MLTIDQLGFRYRRHFLFRQLTFEVNQGQLWHIKGPNGCGKSTLMRLLVGRREPTEGDVFFHDESRPVAKQFEYLAAEHNGLFRDLSAMANLRFWQRWKSKADDDAIWRELQDWGFAQRLVVEDFPVATFSTGMKRKLSLARVVLSGAPLWLLDEPLYGLDEQALATFRRKLASHCDNGGAVVTVSHDDAAFGDVAPATIDLASYAPTRQSRRQSAAKERN